MSLMLDPVSTPAAPKVAPVLDRCSGLSWAASLTATCGPEAFTGTMTPVTVAESAPAGAGADTGAPTGRDDSPGETFSGFGLPTLGSMSAARFLRAAREVPVQAGKAVDLLFRFASKYRLRSSEDGWEVFKFKDVTSENRTQPSGVKGLGVELLFPFE